MAGFDDVPQESDASGHLLDWLILSGLFAGFGLLLATSFQQRADVVTPPVDSFNQSNPQAAVPATSVNRVSPSSKPSNGGLAVPKFVPAPAVAERFIPAAVAEKSQLRLAVAQVSNDPINRPRWTQAELASQLLMLVPEVGLNPKQAQAALNRVRAPKPISKRPDGPEETVLALLDETTTKSLPFRMGRDCQLDEEQAQALDIHAELLHSRIDLTKRTIERRHPTTAFSRREEAVAQAIRKGTRWQREDAVPALVQILQVESEPVRGELVELLGDFESDDSTRALVNRAVFDLSPQVRQDANLALKWRNPDGYRREVLEALRYPWTPAAWHAAETLVAVNDKHAVPDLVELLDAPDPAQPFADETGTIKMREVVRINHFQNCLLCHSPSRDDADLIKGAVPVPFQSPRGGFSYGRRRIRETSQPEKVFVRADATYLRQDFSVMHDVNNPAFGHSAGRFDYLVRTRNATQEEIAAAEATPVESAANYPQRDAVLYALQKLTGQNLETPKDFLVSQQAGPDF